MKNEREVAGMIMDSDIPKRLEAENAKMREALRLANITLSMIVGHDGELPADFRAECFKTLEAIDAATIAPPSNK